jgi:hypothetical protein
MDLEGTLEMLGASTSFAEVLPQSGDNKVIRVCPFRKEYKKTRA